MKKPNSCDKALRIFENTWLRLVFSTFASCSQMPIVFYHSVNIHGLGLRTLEDLTISVKLSRIDFTSSLRRLVYDFRRVSLLWGKILLGCDITCKIEKR